MLVRAGDTAAIVAYLEHEPAAVDRGDPALSGTTPLLLALRLGRDEAAEVLLDGGADLNLAGAWGLTPLMYAAVFGRKQAVASMLRRGGASVEVHATDVHGSTALVHAQAERQHAIVELLVEHLDKYGGGASPSGRPAEAAATHSSQSGFNIQPMSAAQIEGASRRLSPLERAVSLEAATEPPFKGKTVDGTRWDDVTCAPNGIYCGAVSGLPLFRGVDKYDSGSGWPSFTQPFDEEHIAKVLEPDGRVEVIDAKSRAHLGHVFDDGPPPTGLRYCINAAALEHLGPGQGEPRFVRGTNRYVMPQKS